MISAIIVMVGIALILGAILGMSSIKFRVEGNPLIEKVDKLLPQSQCGQCGFPGCRPYAEALAEGKAEINLCIPGGNDTAHKVADLLGKEFKPVGGADADAPAAEKPKRVAFIDERLCIGCTACIKACPVDAIVGTTKQVHTVLISECTGCEQCVAPCPVENCIVMEPIETDVANWKWDSPDQPMKRAS